MFRNWRNRYMVLEARGFGKLQLCQITYYKTSARGLDSWKPRGVVSLHAASVGVPIDAEAKSFSNGWYHFNVHTACGKQYPMKCRGAAERNAWVAHIEAAVHRASNAFAFSRNTVPATVDPPTSADSTAAPVTTASLTLGSPTLETAALGASADFALKPAESARSTVVASASALPRLKSLTAVVPEGCCPGAHVLVSHQDSMYTLQVPRGANSGDRFLLHVPSALEIKSPTGNGEREWWRAAELSPASASANVLSSFQDSSLNLLAAALAADEVPRYKRLKNHSIGKGQEQLLNGWPCDKSESNDCKNDEFEVVTVLVDVRDPLGITFGAPGGRLIASDVDAHGQCASMGLREGCRVVSFGGELCQNTQDFKNVLVDRKERLGANQGPAMVGLQFLAPHMNTCENVNSCNSSRSCLDESISGDKSKLTPKEFDVNEGDTDEVEDDVDDPDLFEGNVQAFIMNEDDIGLAQGTDPADFCVVINATTSSDTVISATASNAEISTPKAVGPSKAQLHVAALAQDKGSIPVPTTNATLAAEGWNTIDLGGGRATLWVVMGEPKFSTLSTPQPGALTAMRTRMAEEIAQKEGQAYATKPIARSEDEAEHLAEAMQGLAKDNDRDGLCEANWLTMAKEVSTVSPSSNTCDQNCAEDWLNSEEVASESVLAALAAKSNWKSCDAFENEESVATPTKMSLEVTSTAELAAEKDLENTVMSAKIHTAATTEDNDVPHIVADQKSSVRPGMWASTWTPVFSPRESLPYAGDLKSAMQAADRPAIKAIMEHRAAFNHSKAQDTISSQENTTDQSCRSDASLDSSKIASKTPNNSLPYGGDLTAAMKAADRPAIKAIMDHRAATRHKHIDSEDKCVNACEAAPGSNDGVSDKSGKENGTQEVCVSKGAKQNTSVSDRCHISVEKSDSTDNGSLGSVAMLGKSLKSLPSSAVRKKTLHAHSSCSKSTIVDPSLHIQSRRDAGLRVHTATVEAHVLAESDAERQAEIKNREEKRKARGEAARMRMEARKGAATSRNSNSRVKSGAVQN